MGITTSFQKITQIMITMNWHPHRSNKMAKTHSGTQWYGYNLIIAFIKNIRDIYLSLKVIENFWRNVSLLIAFNRYNDNKFPSHSIPFQSSNCIYCMKIVGLMSIIHRPILKASVYLMSGWRIFIGYKNWCHYINH